MIARRGWRAGLLAGAASLAMAANAGAEDFSGMVVFGDSLVDAGQRIDPGLTTGLVPGLPNTARWTYTSRGTDRTYGAPYASQLATKLGLTPPNPSQPQSAGTFVAPAPGLNFAVAGARTTDLAGQVNGTNVVPATPFFPTTTTGSGFLNGPNAAAANGALALISAGGNDMRGVANVSFTPTGGISNIDLSPDAAANLARAQGAAGNVAQAARALLDAGVKMVIVPNIPNLGDIPETDFDAAALRLAAAAGALPPPLAAALAANPNLVADLRTQATTDFNSALLAQLNGLGGRVLQVDFRTLFDAIAANPTAFGLANIDQTASCFNGREFTGIACTENTAVGITSATPNPTLLLFDDGIHPTTTAAGLAADLIAALVQTPAKIALAPVLPLESGRQTFEAVEDAIDRARDGAPGFQPFIGIGGGRTDYEGGVDSVTYSGTGGVTYATENGVVAGAAVSWQGIDAEAALGDPEFGGNVLAGSLFAGVEHGRFFADVAGVAGIVNMDDISRSTSIGPRIARNSGDTDGSLYGASARAGADLIRGDNWSLGPLARLSYLSSSLDGFTETGDSFTAMQFGNLDATSTRGGLGMFMEGTAPFVSGLATGRIELSYEHEFEGKADDFTAGAASLAGAQTLFSGRQIDQGGLHLGLTLNADMGFATASVGFDARLGDEQDSQSIRGQIAIPF